MMTTQRNRVQKYHRWVIKVGSALLTNSGKGLDQEFINRLCQEIATLKAQGNDIVLVSSGSIAQGIAQMRWATRPKAIEQLQAAAAIGQVGLIHAYQKGLQPHSIGNAQILLTHEDLANRRRYLNARDTLNTLLKLNILPIVNENDTVATAEIRLGDNDNLGALVANLIDAEGLILLTDQKGLYNKDPRKNMDAKLIHHTLAENPDLLQMAGPSGTLLGSGGMNTKIHAARRASRSGCDTFIAHGHEQQVLQRITRGENIGTWLTSDQQPLIARKQWLANQLNVRGQLIVDDGAKQQLCQNHKSLLPVGVIQASGDFNRGDLVSCCALDGAEIARGLINYNIEETQKIMRHTSKNIQTILGYTFSNVLIHKDDLVLLNQQN